ncbi:glycine cleavage system protein GcvH [Persicimonas caeni]|uniref:Glycine cleavage system H protein n=2 Tax=Persicimonas caeni TaxID=2292766 RepID=A0A4Y6Q312_PERCE|nr:glycine cleavage system protein GcvH [Persicimonas caeni]QED36200.1 glycine cleavage system protein GcvH [Persicimonas caeni]
MQIPEGYLFTDEHEWARQEDDGTITIGISWHAQDLLGDIVYVELPEEGEAVDAGEEFGVVESVKAASDLYSPVSGKVVEVNHGLDDAPESVNEGPYKQGWMIRVEPSDVTELEELMDPEEYASFVSQE